MDSGKGNCGLFKNSVSPCPAAFLASPREGSVQGCVWPVALAPPASLTVRRGVPCSLSRFGSCHCKAPPGTVTGLSLRDASLKAKWFSVSCRIEQMSPGLRPGNLLPAALACLCILEPLYSVLWCCGHWLTLVSLAVQSLGRNSCCSVPHT